MNQNDLELQNDVDICLVYPVEKTAKKKQPKVFDWS